MLKRLLSATALLLIASGAQSATVYVLDSVSYVNSFGSSSIVCDGCGTGTATDDGFGNITLAGVSFSTNAGQAVYSATLAGTTTLAVGTTLINSGGSCTYISGADICDSSATLWGLGQPVFYTGLASDGTTNCANNRCRVDVLQSGNTLTLALKRALSQSATSGASGTWTFGFTVVPVPGAVWLFGSAFGLLAFARRKAA